MEHEDSPATDLNSDGSTPKGAESDCPSVNSADVHSRQKGTSNDLDQHEESSRCAAVNAVDKHTEDPPDDNDRISKSGGPHQCEEASAQRRVALRRKSTLADGRTEGDVSEPAAPTDTSTANWAGEGDGSDMEVAAGVGREKSSAPALMSRDIVGKREAEEGDVLSPSAEVGEVTNGSLRQALVGFYSVHNPDRIENVDIIMEQYTGKEGLLLDRLEQKYSVDLSYARRTAEALQSSPRNAAAPTMNAEPSARAMRSSVPREASLDGRAYRAQPPGQAQVQAGSGSGDPLGASRYMTYLADQIRSNVEGFLPASGSGSGADAGNDLTGRRRITSSASTQAAPSSPVYGAQIASSVRGSPKRLSDFAAAASSSGAERTGSVSPGTGGLSRRHKSPAQSMTRTAGGDARGGNGQDGAGGDGQQGPAGADPGLFGRVRALEQERAGLLSACRRLQDKADAAAREAAATEELREAGQRKLAGVAARAAAAERQAREYTTRLRALESTQAALQAEKEAFERQCAVKHNQLVSAIDQQLSLKSQLEALLEAIPPALPSETRPAPDRVPPDVSPSTIEEGGEEGDGAEGFPTPEAAAASRDAEHVNCASSQHSERETREQDPALSGGTNAVKGKALSGRVECGAEASGGDGAGTHIEGSHACGGGGDDGGGGGIDDLKRRCGLLEVSLRASQVEASSARRARVSAEGVVSEQRDALTKLRDEVSELRASLEGEREAGKAASRAASGLEKELELRLADLRKAEANLAEQTQENVRLTDSLRGATARLQTASEARVALLDVCRQERAAIEEVAAEHVSRAEELAGMRGEEGFARGLELARMAEDAGEKKNGVLIVEIERLGKALFTARASLASSEAREQALRRELGRAAETIAGLSNVEPIVSDAIEETGATPGSDDVQAPRGSSDDAPSKAPKADRTVSSATVRAAGGKTGTGLAASGASVEATTHSSDPPDSVWAKGNSGATASSPSRLGEQATSHDVEL